MYFHVFDMIPLVFVWPRVCITRHLVTLQATYVVIIIKMRYIYHYQTLFFCSNAVATMNQWIFCLLNGKQSFPLDSLNTSQTTTHPRNESVISDEHGPDD